MPSRESHNLAGGEAEDRNSPAVNYSLEMRSGDGEATKDWVLITTPRYCTTWNGTRWDFSRLITTPNSWQSPRTVWRSRRRDSREDDWTSQSSRYLRMQIPIAWTMAETGAMTREKTCGAVDRPKHRALNWKM